MFLTGFVAEEFQVEAHPRHRPGLCQKDLPIVAC
jgi:hypothetical protein